MAVDIFLKIAGIPGESRDGKHKDEIEVLSYSWGLSQGGTAAAGAGAAAGKASFQDFSFTMPVSKASPKLWLACASGQRLADATLTVRRAGEQQLEFLVYSLSDCAVTSYQQGGAEGDVIPTDQVSINYAKIDTSYKEQREDGSVGAETRAGWDLKQNQSF